MENIHPYLTLSRSCFEKGIEETILFKLGTRKAVSSTCPATVIHRQPTVETDTAAAGL